MIRQRRWFLVTFVAVLATSLSIPVFLMPVDATPPTPSPSPAESPTPPSRYDRWQTLWSVPVPNVTDISLSPDGKNIAWTDDKGCVRRLLESTGQPIWRTSPLTGVNRVVAASDGTVAAFSYLNPERTSVVLLNPKFGDRINGNAKPLIFAGSGAVWSTLFAESGLALIGTGGHNVYAVGANRPKSPLFHTEGVPDSLAIPRDTDTVILGTWAPASVMGCRLGSDSPCWIRKEKEPDRENQISISADGSRVLVLSTRGPNKTDGIVRVHDGKSGDLLWSVSLPVGAAEPDAMMAMSGDFIAVTYRRSASHEDADDWKLIYLNREGNRAFRDKGSALFKPKIVAIARDGFTFTVQSGDDTFYILDARGNFLHKLRLMNDNKTNPNAVVERTMASRDGKTLLVLKREGKLMLLRLGN